MAQQEQQAQEPLRPTLDRRFQQSREDAPRPDQLTIPRHQNQRPNVNQEPQLHPLELHDKTKFETRHFAEHLKDHLTWKNGTPERNLKSILKDTDDKAFVTGLLVSTEAPYHKVRIAFPVDSLSSRSSTVFTIFDRESDQSQLTANITFEFKAKSKINADTLRSINADAETQIICNLSPSNEMILNRASPPRGPQEYHLDMKLSQGGYVQLTSGSVTIKDQEGNEKTLELSNCRLYEPIIHSLNKER